jgi:hypothetical protein
MRLLFYKVKMPSLKLKNWSNPHLSSSPFDIALPGGNDFGNNYRKHNFKDLQNEATTTFSNIFI